MKAWSEGVGPDPFGDACLAGQAANDPGGGVAVKARAAMGHEDRSGGALADAEVEGPGGAGGHWHDDDLAALAADLQRAVAPLEAEVADVGPEGLGDAQAVEGEEAGQGMVPGRGEAGLDQDGTELVAVQTHRVGLVVETGAADVDGRRADNQALLFGVAVEAGDGAEATGDGGPSPAGRFERSGEHLDVDPGDGEEGKVSLRAPAGELPQVEGVGLAGQTPIAGQEAHQGHPFNVREEGLGAERAVLVSMGTSLVRSRSWSVRRP